MFSREGGFAASGCADHKHESAPGDRQLHASLYTMQYIGSDMTPTRHSETATSGAPASVPSSTAWYAAIVLMLCYTLSFVDRQILSLLVPFIKADLKINDTLVGLLQGFSFALFY